LHLGRSVDHRERWQALQQHLKSARAAIEAGQRAQALKHADAALALDPAFLAAQTLRERIVRMNGAPAAPAVVAPATAVAEPLPAAPPFAVSDPPPRDPAPLRRQGPDLSQFEARARQRRLEKRVAAAQHGLAAGALADVRAAIDEIEELDPTHPALLPLVDALAAAERDAEHERVVTFVERELAIRPADEAPDLPLVESVTSDVPLVVTAVTPEPAPSAASDLSKEAVVLSSVEAPLSPIASKVQASNDQVVVAIQRVEETVPSLDVARPRRRSRMLSWLAAAAAAFAAVVFAAPWWQRYVPSDGVSEPPPVEVAVTAPAVVPTTDVDTVPIERSPVLNPAAPEGTARPNASLAIAPPAGPALTNAPAREPAVSSTVAPIGTTSSDRPPVASAATAPRPLPIAPAPAPADTAPSTPPLAASPAPPAPTSPAAPPQPRVEPSPSFGISPDMPRQLAVAPIPAPPAAPAARPPASPSAAANVPTRPDDLQQVKDVLQQYRSAYQDLSAERARAIWPAVNEPALQRAFQALESQTLNFDACDVQLRGSTATASCRGTTQYVPKFGSREPRVEPRVWSFTLQKTGEAWQIASARTQR
jgi:hypothetical protein